MKCLWLLSSIRKPVHPWCDDQSTSLSSCEVGWGWGVVGKGRVQVLVNDSNLKLFLSLFYTLRIVSWVLYWFKVWKWLWLLSKIQPRWFFGVRLVFGGGGGRDGSHVFFSVNCLCHFTTYTNVSLGVPLRFFALLTWMNFRFLISALVTLICTWPNHLKLVSLIFYFLFYQ